MLIERFGCFGGMMTTAGVESIRLRRQENTVEPGGLAREIEETAKSLGASSPEPQSNSQAINAERFKLRMQCLNRQVAPRTTHYRR